MSVLPPWHPMTDPVDIKHLDKLIDELGECGAASGRCLIQGIDEVEPTTGYPNREWLEDEIADVLANLNLVVERFGLNKSRIQERNREKQLRLRAWHEEA